MDLISDIEQTSIENRKMAFMYFSLLPGKRCVKKLMMREEMEYDEVVTCHHSYDERCHQTYITTYEPHQEEECDEKFKKECIIGYEEKAVNELVEECTTPLVPDCDSLLPEECKTIYDTVCTTRQSGALSLVEIRPDTVLC